ncbi:dnaJ-like protein 60 [Cephus cinctus]|uniref:DnaJ-like protein 60 n=1 Tax=Cephus cinctus TaxID=211228 RepID=A0AAJ7BJZ7_CEPCN|nr:dnaJ-like protein 60 [Cephus cinctus]
MSQILRTCRPDIFLMCRYYGSQRNQHNYYETLRVSPTSSQKEIREAFIKRSKEIHPDRGDKGSHEEFVKLNEAYNTLGKEHTRLQYDMSNRVNDISSHTGAGAARRPQRVYNRVYTSREEWEIRMTGRPRTARQYDPNNYYGITGIKRVSNLRIALLLFIFSAVGVALQFLAVHRSVTFQRQNLINRSTESEKRLARIHTERAGTLSEQLERFEDRVRQKKGVNPTR